ncbi:MAG: hypothetical protein IPJ74_15500 [Saprospiraceae bacterium]|nr:hypothetical protein [Saprospiraceae bacterium]
MWKTNLKLSMRYLWNHKRYTSMNILALTLGFFLFYSVERLGWQRVEF